MLCIGQNRYELIRVHSGFSVCVYPPNESAFNREQLWTLEMHYVPMDDHYTPREDGKLEYLNFHFRAEKYAVKDWRALSGLGLDSEDDFTLTFLTLENLLDDSNQKESWRIAADSLEVKHQQDYLFRCRFEGTLKREDGTEADVEFDDVAPFREATVYVQLNAPNPVKTAQAMVARNIQLTEYAASKVHSYDPTKPSRPRSHINTHHTVDLTTPWLEQLA